MRWTALAALCAAGCLGSKTVPCPGQNFTCPADTACAAPGYCGDPAQVEKCAGFDDWSSCVFAEDPRMTGSCRHGICEMCTPDREGCATSMSWYSMSLPADVDLTGVWVRDRADAYAVGPAGVLLHYDGTRWSSVPTTPSIPTDRDLLSVWGSDTDDYYIVTSFGDESNLLHVRNGMLSFEGTMATTLKAIWGTSRDNVYAVGLQGAILHFDGNAWSSMISGTTQTLSAIWGTSASVMAIALSGAYTRFDGIKWTSGTIPTTAPLFGVWANDSVAFVAGQSTTLLRFDVATAMWSPVTFDSSVTSTLDLYGVWGTGADYYAVGQFGKILRSADGLTWSLVPTSLGSNDLRAIAGSSADDLFAVGANGAIWHYTTNYWQEPLTR